MRSKCLSEASGRSDWRELSLSWVRAQPITVWPRLASSKARALPSPLPTLVISTVRELAPFIAFIPLYDVVLLLFIHTASLSLFLYLSLCKTKCTQRRVFLETVKFWAEANIYTCPGNQGVVLCGADLLGIRTIPEQPGSTLALGDKFLNHICFWAKMQIVNVIN